MSVEILMQISCYAVQHLPASYDKVDLHWLSEHTVSICQSPVGINVNELRLVIELDWTEITCFSNTRLC